LYKIHESLVEILESRCRRSAWHRKKIGKTLETPGQRPRKWVPD